MPGRLHFPWGYDEPESLRYSTRQFGPKGADAEEKPRTSRGAVQSRYLPEVISSRSKHAW